MGYQVIRSRILLVFVLLAAGWLGHSLIEGRAVQPDDLPHPKSRRFAFVYEATLRGFGADQPVRLWVPLPWEDPHQIVHAWEVQRKGWLAKGSVRVTREPKYGNRSLYWEGVPDRDKEGTVLVRLDVTRYEVRSPIHPNGDIEPRLARLSNIEHTSLSDVARKLYLGPERLVPVGGPSLQLLADAAPPKEPLKLARFLYQRVLDAMRYDKSGTGWGRGDVEWACQSRYGNCSDFHSVFISLARYYGFPARFVMGFPLPEKRGSGTLQGYHCWAYFYVGGLGWVPVDISEADKFPEMRDYYFGNLTENRIAYSQGRDIRLEPPQTGEPLNFFIYPYAEREGKPVPPERISTRFEFTDVPGEQ
jgi:transglutaminase-like putative cysteine protease